MRGYIEVLRRLSGDCWSIRRQLSKRLIEQPPALFVGIDAPDFNLGLETDLRAAGHQDGAFHLPVDLGLARQSDRKIRAAADHVLCIFPFEPELLAQHGIAASYVGHPLANVIPDGARPGCGALESWV